MSERAQGILPSNIEPNPKGQVNTIFLESIEKTYNEKPEFETNKLKEQQLIIEGALEERKQEILDPKSVVEDQDKDEIEQLLETFKQLQVNVPLIDAFLYMPSHIKDLGEVVRNKRKLEESEIITLNEECSAILQNKLPKKLKD